VLERPDVKEPKKKGLFRLLIHFTRKEETTHMNFTATVACSGGAGAMVQRSGSY
jgi:hypothetical protein